MFPPTVEVRFSLRTVRSQFCRGGFSCAVLQKENFFQKGLTFADGFGIIGVLSLLMLCMGEIQKEVY